MATVEEILGDVNFGDFINALYDGGWFQYVFPFLLVYAVVFTILNFIELFEDKKPVKVIIALVFSLFAIAFPITGDGNCVGSGCGETLGDLMMALFPGVSAFAIAILALYIIAAMLGVDLADFMGTGEKPNAISYVLIGLGVLVVIYYFALGFGWDGFNSGGVWGDIEDFLTDPFLYILIIGGLFFWWISKDELSSEQKEIRRQEKKANRDDLRGRRLEEQGRRRERRGA